MQAAKRTLKKLGYGEFQPGQSEAICALMSERSVLAVLPTGGGKSLIYQIVAEHVDGMVLVISPLIALMKDQAENSADIGQRAEVVNSHITTAQTDSILKDVADGKVKILYVTPERLCNEDFVSWLYAQSIGLVVIDEAHCVSEWGHDFRPSYCATGTFLKEFGGPLTLALTATATEFVANDITKQLNMKDPLILRQSVDRPNLYYEVVDVVHEEQKTETLLNLLKSETNHPVRLRTKLHKAFSGNGIIYTATTSEAEELAGVLTSDGISAGYYHGQMNSDERDNVQNACMEGKIRVVIATNAFGMGIDKQDVSFVIHYDVPPNIESYYQEAGRAGRGGDFAACVLMYRLDDMKKAAFGGSSGDDDRKEYEQGRREMMQRYAEQDSCRRDFLLSYFGEKYDGTCKSCDIDAGKNVSQSKARTSGGETTGYKIGEVVKHSSWGNGTIQRLDTDNMTVLFETVGHKLLSLKLITEHGLLRK